MQTLLRVICAGHSFATNRWGKCMPISQPSAYPATSLWANGGRIAWSWS